MSDALRDFYLRSHRVIERALSGSGVSGARARVLLAIVRCGPLRSADLASDFNQAPRTITEIIDGLEREGLVRREPDRDDRRAKRISLTSSGTEAANAAEALIREHVRRVFGTLSAEERGAMIGLLGRLNDRLVELGG